MAATGFGSYFVRGTNQSISIMDLQNNVLVQLDGRRTMMEMKAKDSIQESESMDDSGVVSAMHTPEGWAGSIECEKQASGFSTLVKFLDANYYNGGAQQFYTIVETVRIPGPTGGTETNTYVNCVFHGYEPGQYQKKQITKVRVQIKAEQRV